MSADQLSEEPAAEPAPGVPLPAEERTAEPGARYAPIHLAGYEEDPSETHIVRGID